MGSLPRDFKAVKALKQASKKPLFCLVFIEKPLFFSNSNFQFPKFSPRSRVGAKEQNQPRRIFSYGAVFLCFLPIFPYFLPKRVSIERSSAVAKVMRLTRDGVCFPAYQRRSCDSSMLVFLWI